MANSTKRLKVTDEELRSICERELQSSRGDAEDLSYQRTYAMERYLGEPFGDEEEGRSQFRTREVLETIEWCMPSLMRIFADADNIAAFEPVGPEDEEAAEQETMALHNVFWQQNRGFYNLYSFLKDGLLSKTGILKVWWDDTETEEREEYERLSDWELAELLGDEAVELDVLEHELNDDGTHRIVMVVKRSDGVLRIEGVPPEEFGIDRDARTAFPDDAEFLFHRTRKTKSELIEMGYDAQTVEDLPTANDTLTQERNARRHLSDEQDRDQSDHWSMQRVWVTECHIRIDRDGDGLAELVRVTLAGADSAYTTGSTLLDVEDVDRQPFVVWSPVLLTHKFYGLSVADLVTDLEQIKTALSRQILDNTYLANNGRTAVNERVNLDDLLTSRPGGIVRTKGADSPAQHIMPIPQQPIPLQTFELMQHLDEVRQNRVGVGDEVGALDAGALSNINTGVAALAFDAARAKVELMARICAEIGIRPLFLRMHELLRKNSARELKMRLTGNWVAMRPQAWRERTDMTVKVGIGRVSRERRLVALSDVIQKQSEAIQMGAMGVHVLPGNVYAAVSDYTRELGLQNEGYWTDPATVPPQPEKPNPQIMAIEAQREMTMADAKVRSEKNQIDMAKVQQDGQVRMGELQLRQAEIVLREREVEGKAEISSLQLELKALEGDRKSAEGTAKTMLDNEIKTRTMELEAAKTRAQTDSAMAQREVDILKAIIQSGTTMSVEQLRIGGATDDGGADGYFETLSSQTVKAFEDIAARMSEQADSQYGKAFEAVASRISAQVNNLHSTIEEIQQKTGAPKPIKRDKNGLILSIGDAMVVRDEDGRVIQVG